MRREVPPEVDLGPQTQVLAVVPGASVTATGTAAALAPGLAAQAVRRLEQNLASSPRYQLLAACPAPCPAADAVLELAVAAVSLTPGDARKGLPLEGQLTVQARAVRRDGRLLWAGEEERSRQGGLPGAGEDGERVLGLCAAEAADHLFHQLHPAWVEEAFALEKSGPLAACTEAALRGDLAGAEALARQVLAANPGSAAAHYHLGVLHTARGRLEEALADFGAAAALDARYAEEVEGAKQRLEDRRALQER